MVHSRFVQFRSPFDLGLTKGREVVLRKLEVSPFHVARYTHCQLSHHLLAPLAISKFATS